MHPTTHISSEQRLLLEVFCHPRRRLSYCMGEFLDRPPRLRWCGAKNGKAGGSPAHRVGRKPRDLDLMVYG